MKPKKESIVWSNIFLYLGISASSSGGTSYLNQGNQIKESNSSTSGGGGSHNWLQNQNLKEG